MRKADFTASIKKMELAPKSTTEGWGENIRLTLGDIELTNENLLEIRQFKPSEPIKVTFEPVQIEWIDVDDETSIELQENQPEPPPDSVVKTFKF